MGKKILTYRFSALGDVILIYPVLKAVLEQNPTLKIYFATRNRYASLFNDIERLEVIGVDLEGEYKGFIGLIKLFLKLKKQKYDAIADLHVSLRTRILNFLFYLSENYPISYIDKQRKAKKLFIQKKKKHVSLRHITQNYLEVFKKLGLKVPERLPKILIETKSKEILTKAENFVAAYSLDNQTYKKIGIAPFAQHINKIWGITKTIKLIELLLENTNYQIFLFGGGNKEIEILDQISNKFKKRVVSVAGKFTLMEEAEIIKKMDKFLSMDSSNMHLATLCGIKVYSIWGATDPNGGFYPLYQSPDTMIFSTLPCRPCSIFGDKKCIRNDIACLSEISVDTVYAKLIE